jgi:hypothetical protein
MHLLQKLFINNTFSSPAHAKKLWHKTPLLDATLNTEELDELHNIKGFIESESSF